MSDLLELSAQYRVCGNACKNKLFELKTKLSGDNYDLGQEYELRREITMLTAMYRDCIATSNYLKAYFERRERLEQGRRQHTGV